MANEFERLTLALARRYRILEEVGRGGMATVYRAHDLRHDRSVAIKVLKPELAAALGAERFGREIAVTARLDHPHILPLIDSGEADGLLYYTMPYVEGESLRDRLAREKQLPLEDALQIACEVADALSHAHRKGIIHRDIKPENILLAGGHSRVADFGIARTIAAAGADALTASGLALGTPVYMSPEQATGDRAVDARSDIYSLGSVVYEMLAGQPPYTGATVEAILARKSVEDVPSLRVVRSTVPPAVEEAILKALARVPADRFTTVSDFAQAMRHGSGFPTSVTRNAPRGSRRGLLLGVAALILGLMAGGWAIAREWSASPKIRSLVVLPLVNLSGDPDKEPLVEGIHDAMIGELGRLSTLRRVISWTTAMHYKGTRKSIGEIARELEVDAVVAGTVLFSGDRVRIQVQVLSAQPERVLWSNHYEGHLSDGMTLIARSTEAIADQIEVSLTQREQTHLARIRPVDPVAFELLLRGHHYLRSNLLREARASFQRALERDSTYAPAHVGLARTYNVFGYFGSAMPQEVYPLAREAAQKALRFDESLADAHVQLAWTLAVFDWDWERAERAFQRALQLNPGSVNAHFWYAYFLSWHRRDAQAIAEMHAAIDLDPLALVLRISGAGLFLRVGRCDLALRELEAAKELEGELRLDHRDGYLAPDFVVGKCHIEQGRSHEGLGLMEEVVQSSGPDLLPRYKSELAHAYGVAGRTSDARRLLKEVRALSEQQHVSPYLIALAHAGVGESDSAFAWLDRSYEIRDPWLAFLKSESRWGSVRSDPRFQNLLSRIDLGN